MLKLHRNSAWWRSDLVPVAIVLTLGLVFSAILFSFVHAHFQTTERQRFQRDALYYGSLVTGAMDRHINSLKALGAFVSTRDVNRWEFSIFAEQTLPYNPGLEAVIWAPVVSGNGRAAYEHNLQADGLYGLRIREKSPDGAVAVARQRPAYLPVSYIDPLDNNQDLIGLDLSTDPNYSGVLEAARKANGIALSAPIDRPDEVEAKSTSILVAFPLRAQRVGALPASTDIKGYAIGILNIGRLVASVLPQGAPVEIGVSYGNNPRLLYESASGGAMPLAEWLKQGVFSQSQSFTIGNQSFVISTRLPLHRASSADRVVPLIVALVTIMLSLLLAQHLFRATMYKRVVETAVVNRTAELETANISLRKEVEQRRQAEVHLRFAKENAEIANRAKSQFLATMSHELRTPLNSIIGFSEIIMQQQVDPAREYAQDIHASGMKLLLLINELLDLSQLDGETVSLDEEPVCLQEIVDTAFKRAEPQAKATGVEMGIHYPDEHIFIRADERRLTKALVNLLSNAIKFTPAGGRADISIRQNQDMTVSVVVKDTGIGIPAGDEQRILEPFVQLASMLTREHDGAGLGLAFVNRIAQLHHFNLSIESEPGGGTVVTLTCPSDRVLMRNEAA